MADNFSLRLEALDTLINRLDEVLVKMESTSEQISKFNDIQLNLRLNRGFTQNVEKLKELGDVLKDLDINVQSLGNLSNLTSTLRDLADVANAAESVNLTRPQQVVDSFDSLKKIFAAVGELGATVQSQGIGTVLVANRALQEFKEITLSVSETAKVISLRDFAKISLALPAFITFTTVITKIFDAVSLISRIIPTGIIRDLAYNFGGLGAAIALLPSGQILNEFGSTLNTLSGAVKEMSSVSKNLDFKGILQASKALKAILAPLITLSKVGIRSGSLSNLNLLVRGIADLVKSLEVVSDAAKVISKGDLIKVSAVFLVFGGLVNIVTRIAVNSSNLGPIKALTNFIKSLASLINSASLIPPRIKDFKLGDLKGLIPIFLVIGSLFSVLFKMAKNADPEKLRAVGSAITSLADILTSVNKSIKLLRNADTGKVNLQPIKQVAKAIDIIIKPFKKLANNLISRNVTDEFVNIMQSLSGAIRALVAATEVSEKINSKALRKLAVALTITGVVLGIVAKLTISTGTESKITALGAAIGGMGTFLNALGRTLDRLKDARTGSIVNLIKVVALTSVLFGGIAKLSNSIDEQKILSLGRAFDGISRFMSSFVKALDVFSKKRSGGILGFIKQFTAVKQVTSVINDVVTSLNKIKGANLPQIESIFRSITEILNFTAKLKSDKDFTEKLSRTLHSLFTTLGDVRKIKVNKNVTKFLDVLAKTLGKFGEKTGTLAGISGLKDIASVIRAISGAEGNINASKLKDLPNAAKYIVEFAEQLEDLNIDPAKVTAIAKAVEVSSKDLANNVGDGMKDSFKNGKTSFSERVLAQVLGNVLTKAFDAINPIAVARGFISGLSSLTGSVVNFVREGINATRELFDNIRDGGERIKDLGSNLLQNFGIGRLVQSEAFQAAVGFDKIGKQLQVFGGLTDEQRQKAEDFSFEIGKAYPLSANEALAATLDLIKAGQDLQSTQFILPAAADLAALSDSGDLSGATNALIAAQAVFDEFAPNVEGSFENINKASDLISAAADASVASIEDINQALQNVGPIANGFGLSLLDTTAILAEFSNAGLNGAEAGTQLKSLLNNLRTTTAQKELQKLRVKLTDADGNFRDVADIVNDLNVRYKDLGYTEAQQSASIKNLGGSYGSAGLQILVANDSIAATRDAMLDVAPASERAADLLDNFAGDMVQLKGSVETLLTAALFPLLEEFFRPVVQAIRAVVDALIGLDRKVLKFVATGVVFASTFASIAGAVLVAIGGLIQVGGIIGGVLVAMTNIVAVFGAIVGGIGALAVGFVAVTVAATAFVTIIGGMVAAFGALKTIFSENRGGAVSNLRILRQNIADTVQIVREFVAAAASLARALFPGGAGGNKSSILDAIGQQFANFFASISRVLRTGFIGKIRKGLQDATEIFNVITSFLTLGDQIDAAQADARDALIRFGDGFTQGSKEANAVLDNAAREIQGKFYEIAQALSNNALFQNILGKTSDQIRLGDVIRFAEGIKGIADVIGDTVGGVIADIRTFISNISTEGFGKAFDELKDSLRIRFRDAKAEIVDRIAGITRFTPDELNRSLRLERIPALIRNLLITLANKIKTAIVANSDTLRGPVVFILSYLFNPISKFETISNILGAGKLAEITGALSDTIDNLFGGLYDTVIGLLEGKTLVDALRDAFGPSIEPILNFATSLGDAIDSIIGIFERLFDAFKGPSKEVTQADLLGPFAGVDKSSTGGIQSALTGLLTIFDTLATIVDTIDEKILSRLAEGDISGALTGVTEIITGVLTTLASQIQTQVSTIDFNTIFNTALTAIRDGFFAAVGAILTGVENVTGIDFTPVLTFVSDSIKNIEGLSAEGEGNIFFNVASTILTALVTAITTAMAGIGGALGIDTDAVVKGITDAFGPVITAIANFFVGTEDQASTLSNVKTFIENLVSVINDLLVGVFGKGTEAEQGSEGFSAAFQLIADAFGKLVDLGLGALAITLDTINGVLKDLTALNKKDLENLAIGIGAIGVAFLILNGPAIIGAVAALLPFAGAILAVFVAVQFVKAIVSNLDKFADVIDRLRQLDIGGALIELAHAVTDTLVDLGFNILEVLGIDEVFGQTREELKKTTEAIFGGLQAIVERIGLDIRSFFENSVAGPIRDFFLYDLPFQANQAALTLEAAGNAINSIGIENVLERIRNDLIKFNEDLRNGQITTGLVQNLSDALNKQGNFAQITDLGVEQARLTAASNAELIAQSFIDELNSGDISDQTKAAYIGIFSQIGEGGVQDAIKSTLLTQGVDAASLLISTLQDNGVEIPPGVFNGLADSVVVGFSSALGENEFKQRMGQLDVIEELFKAAGLDTASIEAARSELTKRLGQITPDTPDAVITPADSPFVISPSEIQVKAGPDTPTSLIGGPVTAETADVLLTTADNAKATVDGLVTAQVDQPVTVEAPIEITPTDGTGNILPKDLQNLKVPQTPEEVMALVSSIQEFIIELNNAKTKTDEFTATADVADTAFQNLDTTVTTLSTDTATSLETFKTNAQVTATEVQTSIQNLINTVTALLLEISLIAPALALQSILVIPPMQSLEATLTRGFVNVTTIIRTVRDEIKGLADDIGKAVAAAALAKKQLAEGVDVGVSPPGAAKGANVRKGDVFQVAEAGASEILKTAAGDLYLLGGAPGEVLPLSALPDVSSARSTSPAPAPISSGRDLAGAAAGLTFREGDVIIQVGGGVTPATLNDLQTRIREELARRDRNRAQLFRATGRA